MKITINPLIFLKTLIKAFFRENPVQIYFGSASSGKSFNIMMMAVFWALQGRTVLIARKEQSQLRRSVWAEVKKAMTRLKLERFFELQISQFQMLSKIGKGAIMFTGVDDPDKLKSITAPMATAIDTVILEEADSFTEEDFDQLRIRCRGYSKFPKRAIVIFNPVSIAKMKWLYDRYFRANGWDDETDMVFENEEVYIQRCVYGDNEYLTPDDIEKMERLKDQNPRKYRVYGEGRFGASGKVVFDPNKYWVEDFDIGEKMSQGYLLRIGGDFGYVHASTMVISLWDKRNSTIYIIGLVYEYEQTKEKLAKLCKDKLVELGYSLNTKVLFDSAEPASIRTLQDNGLRGAVKAKKGQGSVTRQVDLLQSQTIIIHPDCKEIQWEMESLNFKKNADGTYNEELDDSNGDDGIAGLRYAYSFDAWKGGKSIAGGRVDLDGSRMSADAIAFANMR